MLTWNDFASSHPPWASPTTPQDLGSVQASSIASKAWGFGEIGLRFAPMDLSRFGDSLIICWWIWLREFFSPHKLWASTVVVIDDDLHQNGGGKTHKIVYLCLCFSISWSYSVVIGALYPLWTAYPISSSHEKLLTVTRWLYSEDTIYSFIFDR